MRVKIINLNVWYGGRKTWDNIVPYLLSEKPDILFVQEAYESTDQNSQSYMQTVASFKKLLGFSFAEYETQFTFQTDYECAPMGNAILSNFPLSNKKVLWLQGNGPTLADQRKREEIPEFPRNLLHCQVTIGQNTYNLMTLQGVWAKDSLETERQKEMGRRISEYIQNVPNLLMAGDFNVNENTETVASLEKHLTNIFKGERTTSFNMQQKTNPGFATAVVDFVFASPNIKVLEHYTPEVNVSDHQSQVTILDL